jgi:hypothetical protein
LLGRQRGEMFEAVLQKENIVHVGAILYLVGFLFRDQILLRAFVVAGDLVYILYFLLAPETPLWGGIFWSVIFTLVNVWMIARIVTDRTHFGMTPEEQQLFNLLGSLSPGEFRRLMKAGRWVSVDRDTVLTEEGKRLDRLYYVLSGTIAIEKAGHSLAAAPPTFIGEVAFLLSRHASATVTIAPGARYVVWEMASLKRQLVRAPALAVALGVVLNRDMAGKVARA